MPDPPFRPGPLGIINLPQVPIGAAPKRIQQLGPYEIETLIHPHEEGGITAYRVRVGPHQTTPVSFHKMAEEIYYVLEGSGMVLLDGQQHILAAGHFLRLPPGTTHSFRTEKDPLLLLNLHAPGSRPDHDVYFLGPTPYGFSVIDER